MGPEWVRHSAGTTRLLKEDRASIPHVEFVGLSAVSQAGHDRGGGLNDGDLFPDGCICLLNSLVFGQDSFNRATVIRSSAEYLGERVLLQRAMERLRSWPAQR